MLSEISPGMLTNIFSLQIGHQAKTDQCKDSPGVERAEPVDFVQEYTQVDYLQEGASVTQKHVHHL